MHSKQLSRLLHVLFFWSHLRSIRLIFFISFIELYFRNRESDVRPISHFIFRFRCVVQTHEIAREWLCSHFFINLWPHLLECAQQGWVGSLASVLFLGALLLLLATVCTAVAAGGWVMRVVLV